MNKVDAKLDNGVLCVTCAPACARARAARLCACVCIA
jgi:hypothetical protein